MNDTIFITGGAKRIGKAIVAHFHKLGWNVIFQYRTSSESAQSISEELNGIRSNSCFAYQADLDSLNDINRLCNNCLLYTSPSPRDLSTSRMPSSA